MEFPLLCRAILSGHLFGWFRDFCGLLSSFEVLILSDSELGITSSTASQFFNSTGRTRKFGYHSLFNPHLVVCFWEGKVQFSSCSFHLVCVVLVAHNFTELNSGRADFGYLAFGELLRFVYCLLQKVKRSNHLPVIESGKRTCFQLIRALGQLLRNIFWKGPVFLHHLRRSTAASSAKSSVGNVVVSSKIS